MSILNEYDFDNYDYLNSNDLYQTLDELNLRLDMTNVDRQQNLFSKTIWIPCAEELTEWRDGIKRIIEEGETINCDFCRGITLINDDVFEDYCKEIIHVDLDIYIDWDSFSDDLKHDYYPLQIGNSEFWVKQY